MMSSTKVVIQEGEQITAGGGGAVMNSGWSDGFSLKGTGDVPVDWPCCKQLFSTDL